MTQVASLFADARAREVDSGLIFSRRTDWIVVILASIIGGGLYLYGQMRHSALLTPIDPNLRAGAIGAGVFVGVLLAGVTTDAWKLGIGFGSRPAPRGLFAILSLLALIGACGAGGNMLAEMGVEWRAFHGVVPTVVEQGFHVTGRHISSRHSDSIALKSDGGAEVTLNCSRAIYNAVAVGDRLVLPVETGRNGVQRTTIPNDPRQLRRD